ncbi:MAG: nitroreductase family protein [Deltaproteobacteria bacterium]|nr:nitroreductase family protein [Deltaproteobacteria bacterium]
MEFADVVKKRRSCRSFETTAVSPDQLNAILDAGRWAPNPLNLQPWEFIIITQSGIKSQVRGVAEEALHEAVGKGGPKWVAHYNLDFLEEAPVLVVVIGDRAKGGLGSLFGQEYGALQAASACIENMLLAATEAGLASLWFTFFRPERLGKVLNVPDHLEIVGVIPIGKPKGLTKAPPRNELKIHRERYGKPSC